MNKKASYITDLKQKKKKINRMAKKLGIRMLKYFCGLSRDMNLLAGACFYKIATRLNVVAAIKSLPPLIFNESCLNFGSEHFYHLQGTHFAKHAKQNALFFLYQSSA